MGKVAITTAAIFNVSDGGGWAVRSSKPKLLLDASTNMFCSNTWIGHLSGSFRNIIALKYWFQKDTA